MCLLHHISRLECLFILKILSRTQWAMEVKIFVSFSRILLHCRDQTLRPMYSRPFFCGKPPYPLQYLPHVVVRVLHFNAFIFLTPLQDLSDQQERATCPEGMYVKVIGHLKQFNKQRNIVAFKIRPIEDFNEVTHHMAEVMYAHLAVTKSPPLVRV